MVATISLFRTRVWVYPGGKSYAFQVIDRSRSFNVDAQHTQIVRKQVDPSGGWPNELDPLSGAGLRNPARRLVFVDIVRLEFSHIHVFAPDGRQRQDILVVQGFSFS